MSYSKDSIRVWNLLGSSVVVVATEGVGTYPIGKRGEALYGLTSGL